MNKGHFSLWLCLSSSLVLLPSNLSPSLSPSFSPLLSAPHIFDQCRGLPAFFLPPSLYSPSWRQMELWLTGGNAGLQHGVNRSGCSKVCARKNGGWSLGRRNTHLGGKRFISKWKERQWEVRLHVSTLVVLEEATCAPFVAPVGLSSGWALCRPHPVI